MYVAPYMKKPLQILLIDDDEDEHVLFSQTINEIDEHIDCYHAQSGEDALRMLRSSEHLPDYIFLDLNMPCMDGKQCLREIKGLYDIPVIIYTTSKSQRDRDDTKHMGAQWFLIKPNSYGNIKKSVEVILNDINTPKHIFSMESGIYKF